MAFWVSVTVALGFAVVLSAGRAAIARIPAWRGDRTFPAFLKALGLDEGDDRRTTDMVRRPAA